MVGVCILDSGKGIRMSVRLNCSNASIRWIPVMRPISHGLGLSVVAALTRR